MQKLRAAVLGLGLTVFAAPAQAGIFDWLFGDELEAIRVQMHVKFINNVEYSSHDYCDFQQLGEKKCIVAFTMGPDNVIPKSRRARNKPAQGKLHFTLERQVTDGATSGYVIAYSNREHGNDHFAVHSHTLEVTAQDLLEGKALLPLLYDKSAVAIVGFTPDRKRFGTVTFITSPDDR